MRINHLNRSNQLLAEGVETGTELNSASSGLSGISGVNCIASVIPVVDFFIDSLCISQHLSAI